MIKNLKYMNIEYTDNDLEYIDYICEEIDKKSEDIIKFFELKEYKEKVDVKLFENIEEFRKFYKETFKREPKDYVCGFSKNNNVYTLSLSEYRKCSSHEKAELKDLISLILHEFTHSVHFKRNNNMPCIWLNEGAATYLSNQYNDKKEIICTLDDLINGCPYYNYKLMFEYVLNTYGKEYILKLIDNEELLDNETRKLFEEAKLYTNIKTPNELNEYMNKNILYGYLGKNNKIYMPNDSNFDKDWLDNYILENAFDILNTKVGNCWDQVEFERNWFENNNYEYKTIYHQVLLNYDNSYPTHTFLIYKENDKWYWFENAWEDMKGIHEYNTLEELLNDEYNKNIEFLKTFNITAEEIEKIKYFEFNKPKEHISAMEYVKYILNSKEKIINDDIMDNLYLKQVEETDIDILNKYNNDCINNNSNPWISEDTFQDKIKKWKEEQSDNSKVHFIPFWLLNNDKVIGLAILKTNIETDEIWKEYGGNISYVITPSNRNKGYGTKCLHLALQKCMELGLENILITCDINNIASKKIIESNCGVLKDCITDKNGNEEYRYNINVEESLNKYDKNTMKM